MEQGTDVEVKTGGRLANCCKYHWPGIFHFVTLILIIPLWFLEPVMIWRSMTLFFLMFLWYLADDLPPGIIGFLPALFFPYFGIVKSNDICMAYAMDSCMVLALSYFIATSLYLSKTTELLAYFFLRMMPINIYIIHSTIMIMSYLLSIISPNMLACAFMLPFAKSLLEVMQSLGIGSIVNHDVKVGPDDYPYPSKLTVAFGLGVAFGSNLGGISLITSSQTGYAFYHLYKTLLGDTPGGPKFFDCLIIEIPLGILTLIITMLYLQLIFLGLFMKNRKVHFTYEEKDVRTFLNEAIKLQPPPTIYNVLVCFMYIFALVFCWLLKPIIFTGYDDILDTKEISFSASLMFVCLILFITPRMFYFCKYYICKKPSQYKPVQSLLLWSSIIKVTSWGYFFVYGGSVALALGLKRAHIHSKIGEFLADESISMKIFGWFTASILLTTMCSDYMLAHTLMNWVCKMEFELEKHPGILMQTVYHGSSLSFLLPTSSSANCMTCGWFNIRAKQVILGSLGPTIFGFILYLIIDLMGHAGKLDDYENKPIVFGG